MVDVLSTDRDKFKKMAKVGIGIENSNLLHRLPIGVISEAQFLVL